MSVKEKIHTFLVPNGQVEAAINFYVSLFPNSRIWEITRYKDNEGGEVGTIKQATLSLYGADYRCVDWAAKAEFLFTPALSLSVDCDMEEEIQSLLIALVKGGKIRMEMGDYGFSKQFGWVEDKFGVS